MSLKADLYLMQNDKTSAQDHYNQAHQIFKELNEPLALAKSTLGLARTERLSCRFPEALNYLTEAQEQFQPFKESRRYVGLCYIEEAKIDRLKGNLKKALQTTKKALRIFSPLEGEADVAKTFMLLGQLHRDLGQTAKAWSFVKQALSLYMTLDDKIGMAKALNLWGSIYFSFNKIIQTKSSFEKAEQIAIEQKAPLLKAQTEKNFARILMDQGFLQKAEALLLRSLETAVKEDHTELRIQIHLELAQLDYLIGSPIQALEHAEQASHLVDTNGLFLYRPQVDVIQAEGFTFLNEEEKAKEKWSHARARAFQIGSRKIFVESSFGFAEIALKEKNTAALANMIPQIEKQLRTLNSPKHKIRLSFLKGRVAYETSGQVDWRTFRHSLKLSASAGLPVLLRLMQIELMGILNQSGSRKEIALLTSQADTLLKEGAADLYLIRPRHEMATTLAVSLVA